MKSSALVQRFFPQIWHRDALAALSFAAMPACLVSFTQAPAAWPLVQIAMVVAALRTFGSSGGFGSRLALFLPPAAFTLVLNLLYGTSFYLQNQGFSRSVLYHLHPDSLFAGVSEFGVPLILSSFYIICSLTLLAVALSPRTKPSLPARSLSAGVMITCLLLFPPTQSAAGFLFEEFSSTVDPVSHQLAQKLSVTPEVVESAPPKNLVMIYAEGLERSYFDELRFPQLVPGLQEFSRRSVDFAGLEQVEGTSWTVAGMVSSQCGVPLHSRFGVDGNDYGLFTDFLPRAKCLGDELAQRGYTNVFIGGADTRFAGKANFLRSHGFDRVIGRQELEPHLAASTHAWGLYDEDLFASAKEEFERLIDQQKPFSLVLLTLDTHHPRGHPSPSCAAYPKQDNPILHAVHCTDQIVVPFINFIRRSRVSSETTIVLLSDHLAMRNTASELLSSKQRNRKLTFIIDTPQTAPDTHEGAATHFDIAPTVIESLGFHVQGPWGLGHSLWHNDKGFLAKHVSLQRASLAVRREPLASRWDALWHRPRHVAGTRGIEIDPGTQRVTLQGGAYSLTQRHGHRRNDYGETVPTAFELDPQDLSLVKIHRNVTSPASLHELFFNRPEHLYLVIAPAQTMGASSQDTHSDERLFYFFGIPSATKTLMGPVDDAIRIEGNTIIDVVNAAKSRDALARRLRELK